MICARSDVAPPPPASTPPLRPPLGVPAMARLRRWFADDDPVAVLVVLRRRAATVRAVAALRAVPWNYQFGRLRSGFLLDVLTVRHAASACWGTASTERETKMKYVSGVES